MTLKVHPYQRQRLHHDLKSKANFWGLTSLLPHDHMLIIIRLDQRVSVSEWDALRETWDSFYIIFKVSLHPLYLSPT